MHGMADCQRRAKLSIRVVVEIHQLSFSAILNGILQNIFPIVFGAVNSHRSHISYSISFAWVTFCHTSRQTSFAYDTALATGVVSLFEKDDHTHDEALISAGNAKIFLRRSTIPI